MWQYVAYLAARTILGTNEDVKTAKAKNSAAMTQLGKQISQINLERAASRQRTSQALFNVQAQGETARSQVQLNAAASGTVGASVKDAVSTVQISEDRTRAGVLDNQDRQEEGFRLMVSKAVDDTSAQMDWQSGSDKLWDNILQNGMQAAGNWVAGKMTGAGGSQPTAKVGADQYSTFDDLDKPDTGRAGGAYNNYGYDLWGSKGSSGVQSWKSYLGNS